MSIRGYRGSLSFDPETKVIKWQVNTDIPKEKIYPQLTFKSDQFIQIVDNGQSNTGATRLPPINVDRPRRLHEFRSSEGDDPNSDPEVLAQKTEELRQYFSLPKIFKATVDTETYKRLCDLGFRRPFYDDAKLGKKTDQSETDQRHVEFVEIPNQAWEADGTDDKDFRIEDLNLNPHSSRMNNIKLTSSQQFPHLSKNEHFKMYLADRDTFFNKYNNENGYDNSTAHFNQHGHHHAQLLKKRHKLNLSEATLFPDSDMYITR